MTTLENPVESPCFGCGPNHRPGLHLAFERRRAEDGVEEIVCEYSPKADEIGWPGLLHIGLLFMIMMETSYWTALTLGGKVMTVGGTSTFDMRRLPRVGRKFRARARLGDRTATGLRIACAAESEEGTPQATLESSWRPASRSSVERTGIVLPPYLLEDMDP